MGFILFLKFWYGEGRVELYIHEEKKIKIYQVPIKKG